MNENGKTFTKIWAHRGASHAAPENTLEAFKLAMDMGADGIELDVHQTRDKILVVAHDETIDRCSNGSGRIEELTYGELLCFDFSNGLRGYQNVRIPTLDEVLSLIGPSSLTVNIEIKTDHIQYEGIEKRTVVCVREHGMRERVLYSSFNHDSLLKVREADPSAPIGLLYSEELIDPHVYAVHLGAQAIHPYYPTLMVPRVIEGCKEHQVAIHTWTVDEPEHIAWLIQSGVEAVITNKPDIALQIRQNVTKHYPS